MRLQLQASVAKKITNLTFKIHANGQKGFSVVEIILSAAIFLIFSSAAVYVTLQGFDANRTGDEKTIANEYASEGVEAARSIRDQSYANLVDTNGIGVTHNAANVWTFNLLSDNSFDSTGGSPWYSPWTSWVSSDIPTTPTPVTYTQSTDAKDGPYSLNATINATDTVNPWKISLSQNNISVVAGQQYTISFWAKASVARSIDVEERVGSYYHSFSYNTVPLTTSWQYITLPAFTPDITTTDTFLGFYFAAATGNVWIDKVSLTATNNVLNKYTRVISVSDVYRDTPDSTGNIVDHLSCSCGTLDPNTKKVTATVTWDVTPARHDTVSQSVYLTNWQAPVTWFDSNYLFKKKIVIDHTKVSGGPLTNFPVLISFTDPDLKANGSGGNCGGSGGCVQYPANIVDILFTDSAQTTKLNHEIENYVPSTGEVEIWVQVPSLSSSADTIIYLYYDNGSITTSPEYKTGVWDSNFMSVWHLKESGSGGSGEYKDSTANTDNGQGGDGTAANVPSRTNGQVAYGQNFNGTTDYIDFGNPASLNLTGTAITLEAWIKYTGTPTTWEGIVNKAGYNNAYRLGVTSGQKLDFELPGITYSLTSTSLLSSGVWQHVVGTYDGSTMRTYINGIQDTATLAKTDAIIGNTNSVWVGQGDNCISQSWCYPFPGSIDEVRISNTARSAGWIMTEYSNQSSPSTFYTVSSAMGK